MYERIGIIQHDDKKMAPFNYYDKCSEYSTSIN